jgi:hypothetical protein
MAEPHFGVVIKPGGVVIFDADLSGEHRRTLIGHLIEGTEGIEGGHTIRHVAGPHPEHGGASHIVLLTGPYSPGEIEGTKDRQAQRMLDTEAQMKADGDEIGDDLAASFDLARARLASGKGKPKG